MVGVTVGLLLELATPRYLNDMLLVPDGGGVVNVSVVPDTEYELGSCVTPEISTKTDAALAGVTDMVYAVVTPVPLNVS